MKTIQQAKQAYESAVTSITLDDLLNGGNATKDLAVDSALNELDRVVRTAEVRKSAAKIKREK